MLEFASILLILSILENQDKYVDSTINSYHKIKEEIVLLSEEFKTASSKRRKIISDKIKNLKSKLKRKNENVRKYDD